VDDRGQVDARTRAAPPASSDEPGPRVAGDATRIEVRGLSVYTHHGVGEAEREVGQRLVLDVALELDSCEATATDRLEDTIDYGEVTREVAALAQARSYRTLESLCAAIADHLVDSHSPASVTVRAAKPEPPIALAVEQVAVAVSRAPDRSARERR
jgi:dihydroneopterin aldolase